MKKALIALIVSSIVVGICGCSGESVEKANAGVGPEKTTDNEKTGQGTSTPSDAQTSP